VRTVTVDVNDLAGVWAAIRGLHLDCQPQKEQRDERRHLFDQISTSDALGPLLLSCIQTHGAIGPGRSSKCR
jgi:hypothetical protein